MSEPSSLIERAAEAVRKAMNEPEFCDGHCEMPPCDCALKLARAAIAIVLAELSEERTTDE